MPSRTLSPGLPGAPGLFAAHGLPVAPGLPTSPDRSLPPAPPPKARPGPGAPPARPPSPDAPPAGAGLPAAWPRQFAQVIVEILAGSRPPRQIVRWTTDRVRTQIGLLIPLLASDRRPRIQRIVTSRPTTSVVEMTVVVSFGPRSRALAMRFEHMPARHAAPRLPARPAQWLCTEVEAC